MSIKVTFLGEGEALFYLGVEVFLHIYKQFTEL